MTIDKNFIQFFSNATSRGAYGASLYKGKGDKIAADKAAVDEMRNELNKINMKGKIVIGEGELDEAPMLFINEEVGTKNGLELDIAVDPLEGTNFTAKNLPNALSVIAVTLKGNLLNAPDVYMEKIAIGSEFPNNLVDLDFDIKKNIKLISDYKSITPDKLTVCVLAASALSCLNCQMQTRLVFYNNEEKSRAKDLGVEDLEKKYTINDMVKGDTIFCATGVTDGDLVKGIKDLGNYFQSETLILHKSSKINKKIINKIKK